MYSKIAILEGPVFWAILATFLLFSVLAACIAVFFAIKNQRRQEDHSICAPPPPGSRLYQFARKGTNIGSYTEGAIRELVANGQLKADDDYWTQGMAQWQKVSTNPSWR